MSISPALLSQGGLMKRVYAVIELANDSVLDPASDEHLDEIAEDLLTIADRVTAVTVYGSREDMIQDEGGSGS